MDNPFKETFGMNTLEAWAARHSVSPEALDDLRACLGAHGRRGSYVLDRRSESEGAVQSRVRLEASRKGLRIWRNNVGAVVDQTGRHIRYGLANDSKQLNAEIKSSDLIGIRPVKVEIWDVGRTVGQFIAREVKASSWQYTGTDREQAQLRFLELVTSMGGDASFAVSDDTL